MDLACEVVMRDAVFVCNVNIPHNQVELCTPEKVEAVYIVVAVVLLPIAAWILSQAVQIYLKIINSICTYVVKTAERILVIIFRSVGNVVVTAEHILVTICTANVNVVVSVVNGMVRIVQAVMDGLNETTDFACFSAAVLCPAFPRDDRQE